ncbi:MAG TPA: FAD-dependent oxidoreductase, partial [Candidatus Bathyarchaeia archaeon]|nr:FAD-dependent oxidoreductase [Candidatus Bathyarchaeia archaeon]
MKKPLIIIGAGPGGYTAAFLAADKGIPVTLVDQDPVLGGVCLNRGCIPTKALIHIAKGIIDGREITSLGVDFGEPKIDIEKIRAFKEGVVSKLTGGLAQLAKQRKVELIHGRASFIAPQLLAIFRPEGGHDEIPFEKAIIATGSLPIGLPFAPASDNI